VPTEQAEQGTQGSTEGAAAKVQQVASQAKEQMQVQAGRMRGQVDRQSTVAAEKIKPFSQALRKAAEHLHAEGNDTAASTANRAADGVEQLARYLRDSSSDRLLGDVEGFARQRPWAAGAVGAAVGFVAARFLKVSSEDRYASSRQAHLDASMPLRREAEASTF
jgi:hypothetical protein